ncbi:MAG: hypothetical protein ACO3GH_05115, partial [Ilumatobacteraceae bacterium]
ERAMAQSFLNQIGNVGAIIHMAIDDGECAESDEPAPDCSLPSGIETLDFSALATVAAGGAAALDPAATAGPRR